MSMAFDQADRPDLYARSREERGLDPLPEESDEDDEVTILDESGRRRAGSPDAELN